MCVCVCVRACAHVCVCTLCVLATLSFCSKNNCYIIDSEDPLTCGDEDGDDKLEGGKYMYMQPFLLY